MVAGADEAVVVPVPAVVVAAVVVWAVVVAAVVVAGGRKENIT